MLTVDFTQLLIEEYHILKKEEVVEQNHFKSKFE